MAGEQPFQGPLTVELRFYLPRPKSAPKSREWPTTRPDLDKLARSVLDALTHVCWSDDAQIIELYLNKFWSIDTPVGVDVDVWPTPHTADESVA